MIKITLAAARINANLTQVEAAKRLGISKDTLANWENYRTSPDASKLDAIAGVYNIPIDNLKFSL